MQLVDNWRETLRHAWSVRLILLAAVLSAGEVVMQFATPPDQPLPKLLFGIAAGLVAGAAFVARFVVQRHLSGAQNAQPRQ
jgi:putative flippase GtrA